MKDLEKDFAGILNSFLYGIEYKNLKTEHLSYEWFTPNGDNINHNFQRQNLRNRSYIIIFFRGMRIAEVQRFPKKQITLQKRSPDKAPKGYFATKVLERVLWYRFPGVEVT